MKLTTEQKIIAYINAPFGSRRPRLTTPEVVEYANANGANWKISTWSCTKTTTSAGLRYTTGGGTREYNGYRVEAPTGRFGKVGSLREGRELFSKIYDSTETYRTIGDLLRKLPNYDSLITY